MTKEKKGIFEKLMFFVVIIGLCLTVVDINAVLTAKTLTNKEKKDFFIDDMNNEGINENIKEYKITSIVYNGDKLGRTTKVLGYRIFLYYEKCENGSNMYNFYKIEFANPASSIEELEWYTIPELSTFKIFVADYEDLWNVNEFLNQVPHTTLESYNIYITLMDLIMYDMFKEIILDELVAKNKISYVLDSYDITLPDWSPLITNLEFQIADTYFSYISGFEQKNSEKIFFYKMDESFIKQSMVFEGFKMPNEGTERYMGFIKLNSDNDLVYGTISSYWVGKVTLFKFINLYSFTRREQVIELIG